MIGAIAGDIIGSIYEGAGTKTKQFPLLTPFNRFTDTSVFVACAGSGSKTRASTSLIFPSGLSSSIFFEPTDLSVSCSSASPSARRAR